MHSKKTIAVLFHDEDHRYPLSRYVIHQLADFWRADGHEVIYLFGVKRHVAADIIIVHINLTVVPAKYVEFAARYPICLNGLVRDIRKSTISTNIVNADESWNGPVIVKSNLNCAGGPELLLRRSWIERRSWKIQRLRRWLDRFRGDPFRFVENSNYPIFEHVRDVPAHLYNNRHVVVEKFRPEVVDGLFCIRVYQFLGDRCSCARIFSPGRIVKANTGVKTEEIEPHEEILKLRRKFSLDYGKLDYVVSDGDAVLLDVNKTTGASLDASDENVAASRRDQAKGLYSYFR